MIFVVEATCNCFHFGIVECGYFEAVVEVPLPLKQCSFERIYFSRGNDAGVYREREELGRLLLAPLLKLLGENKLSLANTVPLGMNLPCHFLSNDCPRAS